MCELGLYVLEEAYDLIVREFLHVGQHEALPHAFDRLNARGAKGLLGGFEQRAMIPAVVLDRQFTIAVVRLEIAPGLVREVARVDRAEGARKGL